MNRSQHTRRELVMMMMKTNNFLQRQLHLRRCGRETRSLVLVTTFVVSVTTFFVCRGTAFSSDSSHSCMDKSNASHSAARKKIFFFFLPQSCIACTYVLQCVLGSVPRRET